MFHKQSTNIILISPGLFDVIILMTSSVMRLQSNEMYVLELYIKVIFIFIFCHNLPTIHPTNFDSI